MGRFLDLVTKGGSPATLTALMAWIDWAVLVQQMPAAYQSSVM